MPELRHWSVRSRPLGHRQLPRCLRLGGLLALGFVVTVLIGPACSRGEFEDRTAKVDIDGRTTTYQLDACGLDGSTLFVVGRSAGGAVLQGVVGLGKDHKTGVTRSTGLTVTDDGVDLGAFGAESWDRRGQDGDPPGRITRTNLRGSRIEVSGLFVTLDAEGAPTAQGSRIAFTVDARCDDQEA